MIDRFKCAFPYALMDDKNLDIGEMEIEMRKLQDSASLFEVNMPDFKQLKQCRRELKMLKVFRISQHQN
jgi:dynein heavy chain, axonemal